MYIDVITRDAKSLSDLEISEMADLCIENSTNYDVGVISKTKEDWVLVTQARENDNLVGFSFFTLERIGGTPSLLIGLTFINRSSRSSYILKSLLSDQFRRAALAFPDEDVVMSSRLLRVDCFEAFEKLEDVIPRSNHKITGEERQWARRLAKRFGFGSKFDDQTLVISDSSLTCLFDYKTTDLSFLSDDMKYFFESLDENKDKTLIVHGWAMAEFLSRYSEEARV